MPPAQSAAAIDSATGSPAARPGTPTPGTALDVRSVFDQHFDFVWRSLRRLGIAERDVDDAVQEVFLVVHRKLPEFAGRSKITTWLYGICFRVASEHSRRAYVRREQLPDEMPEPHDVSPSPEERYQGREAREKLDEVLAQLDTDKRAVFVLYEIDEVPVEEIAEMVGAPIKTVYSRLKAAREEFEKALGRLRARWAHRAHGNSHRGGGLA